MAAVVGRKAALVWLLQARQWRETAGTLGWKAWREDVTLTLYRKMAKAGKKKTRG